MDAGVKVIKLSTKRQRQDRLVFFTKLAVLVADTRQVVHRALPWKSLEGIRTRGTGHGAMVVFRCLEEADVCVELQGGSKQSPDVVLAMLAERAQELGLECTAMPAGTDMEAEPVCRRAGRAKVRPRDCIAVLRPPPAAALTSAAGAAGGDGGDGGDSKQIAVHPQLARVLGGVSSLRFVGVVETVNAKGVRRRSLLIVKNPAHAPDLVVAQLDGTVRRVVAAKEVEEIVTLADGSSTPLRIRFRVRAEHDLVAHWISDPLSTHLSPAAFLHDLREAVPPNLVWRAVYDLEHFNEGGREEAKSGFASLLRHKA